MKFPQQHNITKLTLTILKPIVIGIMFLIGVGVGIVNIISKEVSKNDTKTRGTSVQSKIDPKNTRASSERNEFGYPDRSVKE
jgi:F0F1-type ATP synthase assembly protein I